MADPTDPDRLDLLTLAWVWCGGKPVAAAAVQKGLKAYLPSGADVAASLDRLSAAGDVGRAEVPVKGRGKPKPPTFAATGAGQSRAAAAFGRSGPAKFATLSKLELPAVAAALPPPGTAAALRKLLPLAVVGAEIGVDLPLADGAEASKLHLVRLAVARAQGIDVRRVHLKKVPAGELPAIVAGPLLGATGTAAATLDKLVEATACNAVDAATAGQLPTAVVRRWLAAGDRSSPAFDAAAVLAAARRAAADRRVTTNLGDKVLVEAVWAAYGHGSLDDFKRRLAAANGAGVDLFAEDLVPADRRDEYDRSAVRVGPTAYHYVRIG